MTFSFMCHPSEASQPGCHTKLFASLISKGPLKLGHLDARQAVVKINVYICRVGEKNGQANQTPINAFGF